MPANTTLEQAGFFVLVGALLFSLFAAALIVQNHQKTWCKWCKARHNARQFK